MGDLLLCGVLDAKTLHAFKRKLKFLEKEPAECTTCTLQNTFSPETP